MENVMDKIRNLTMESAQESLEYGVARFKYVYGELRDYFAGVYRAYVRTEQVDVPYLVLPDPIPGTMYRKFVDTRLM